MTKEEENGIRITMSNFTPNFPSEYLELLFDTWIIHAVACYLLTIPIVSLLQYIIWRYYYFYTWVLVDIFFFILSTFLFMLTVPSENVSLCNRELNPRISFFF